MYGCGIDKRAKLTSYEVNFVFSMLSYNNHLCSYSFPETSIIPRPRTVRKRELLAKNHSSIKFFSFIKKNDKISFNIHPYTYLDDFFNFFYSLIINFYKFFLYSRGEIFFIIFYKKPDEVLGFFLSF